MWKSFLWTPAPHLYVSRSKVSRTQQPEFISMRRTAPSICADVPWLTQLKLWMVNMLFSGSFDCHSILWLLCHQKNWRKNCVQNPEAVFRGSGESADCPTVGMGGGSWRRATTPTELCSPASEACTPVRTSSEVLTRTLLLWHRSCSTQSHWTLSSKSHAFQHT